MQLFFKRHIFHDMAVFLFRVYLFFYDTLKSFFVSIRIKSVVFHDKNKKIASK